MFWIIIFMSCLKQVAKFPSKLWTAFLPAKLFFLYQYQLTKNRASLLIKITDCTQSLQTKEKVDKIEKTLGKSQKGQNKSKKYFLFS